MFPMLHLKKVKYNQFPSRDAKSKNGIGDIY